ncbi:hypothetical protein [Paraburkholderia terrae]|uniref:hypothetical protein n=1 Tax=Paraburkholderia terrae TaxID=311230 RepID=UPI001EE32B8E|nr:hypothetical protein [Paraburkholderia terrae]GJH04556.1 hypothetical protein CBA19C8_28385 [Paraburkholderia terrae]
MRESAMIRQAECQAQLVLALLKARCTLVVLDGNTVVCDGDEWMLDLRDELETIDAALEMAGFGDA